MCKRLQFFVASYGNGLEYTHKKKRVNKRQHVSIGAVSPAVSGFDLQPPQWRLRIARLSGRFPYAGIRESPDRHDPNSYRHLSLLNQHGWGLPTLYAMGIASDTIPMRLGKRGGSEDPPNSTFKETQQMTTAPPYYTAAISSARASSTDVTM